MVVNTIIKPTYKSVLLFPIYFLTTRMLANEITGSASKYANKGPFAIPRPKNIFAIGTSTKVGKYINTPNKTAIRLADSVFLPIKVARKF